MRKLRSISEAEVISEFLKNEFYQADFNHDRRKFEQIVLEPDLTNDRENAVRRALLYRRRGHMLRELPPDTQWWLAQVEQQDLDKIRVFPRAHWRKISNGSFLLSDIARRINTEYFSGGTGQFISKIQSLSYRLRQERDSSAVLLIGIDENKPMTILEGNHRMTAAVLASPGLLQSQFRVLCGFSPRMAESCWYDTNFNTLWRYLKNRVRNFRDQEADVPRALRATEPAVCARPGIVSPSESLHPHNAVLNSK